MASLGGEVLSPRNLIHAVGELVFFPDDADGNETQNGQKLHSLAEMSISVDEEMSETHNFDKSVRSRVASATFRKDYGGAIKFEGVSMKALSYFLVGDVAEEAIAAAAVSEIFDPVAEGYRQLGITAGRAQGLAKTGDLTLLKGVAGAGDPADALVAADTFSYNEDRGLLYVPAGSGLIGGALKATYTPTARTAVSIAANDMGSVEGALYLYGNNPQPGGGENRDIYIPRCKIVPDGDLMLQGDERQSLAFNLQIMERPGKNLYYVRSRA